MIKNIVVAPAGEYISDVYEVVKEFPTDNVILLVPQNRVKEASEAQDVLSKQNIKVDKKNIKGHIWEGVFEGISDICDLHKEHEIIVNTSAGDKATQCAATSAAFVNGLKAVVVDNGKVMMLPILKFSYYKILTDKKLSILKVLYKIKGASSLDSLAKETGMSLPLVSYHVNGNLKSEGLKELGLINTISIGGKMNIELSVLGRLLIKGYVHPETEE